MSNKNPLLLMVLSPEDRASFLRKVAHGQQPAFKLTYPGDPNKQARLKASLPNIYTAHRLTQATEGA